MKKIFSTRRNALFPSAKISWGALALFLAVCALITRLLAPNLFWRASAPLLQGAGALARESRVFFSGFADMAALASRNKQLINENVALVLENQALLKKETDREALLGSSPERKNRRIIAGVISSPPASPYDTLVLARGADDGVAPGQEAFGNGGVPIGIVSSALADVSRVTLFSAPNVITRGWVGRSNVPLEIRGVGGGSMRASLPRSAAAAGDIVFAPGPGALPIGRVAHIDSDSSSPTETLLIQGALNPLSITWVELRDKDAAFADSFSCETSLP